MSLSTTPPTIIVVVEDLDLSSVQTTTSVQMRVIDQPCSSETELAPADPEECLPPSERIQYVPAAVATCPPNSPLQAANVFKWAATSILGTIAETSHEGDSAFDDGGLVETVAIPYILDLQHCIRDRYYHYEEFDKDCKDLDAVLTDVCDEFVRKQLFRARTGEVDCAYTSFSSPTEEFEVSSPNLNQQQQQQQQQYYPAPPCNDDYMTEDTGYYSADCDLSDSSDFDNKMYDYAHDDGIFDDYSSSSSSGSNADHVYQKAGSVTYEPSLAAGLAPTASFSSMAEPDETILGDEASTSTDNREDTEESDKAETEKSVFGPAAVDARAMLAMRQITIGRRSVESSTAERSEGWCLGVGCLAHERQSRHNRTWGKRRADDRPTRSRVRAGRARIAAGIG